MFQSKGNVSAQGNISAQDKKKGPGMSQLPNEVKNLQLSISPKLIKKYLILTDHDLGIPH